MQGQGWCELVGDGRGTASCAALREVLGETGPELSQADSRIHRTVRSPQMPNLAGSEIALAGLRLAGRGERVFCGLNADKCHIP